MNENLHLVRRTLDLFLCSDRNASVQISDVKTRFLLAMILTQHGKSLRQALVETGNQPAINASMDEQSWE